jgi:hypothetical protein
MNTKATTMRSRRPLAAPLSPPPPVRMPGERGQVNPSRLLFELWEASLARLCLADSNT